MGLFIIQFDLCDSSGVKVWAHTPWHDVQNVNGHLPGVSWYQQQQQQQCIIIFVRSFC